MTDQLTVGSLFAGIGGFDLGFERAGMRTEWFVEIEPYCQAVLRKHWPGVPIFADVREVGAHNLAPVDVLCGGFPCQDISSVGRGAGLAGERSGLWFEFERLIGELRPRYVVVENVRNLRTRGLDAVITGLARLGYDAEWTVIPASAVGAPHRRERIWIVAYPGGTGRREDAGSTFGDEVADAGWSAQVDHLVSTASEERVPAAGRHGVGHPDGTGSQGHGRSEPRAGEWPAAATCRGSRKVGVGSDADRGRCEERTQLNGTASPDPADGSSPRPHADRLRDAVADARGVGRRESHDSSRTDSREGSREGSSCGGERGRSLPESTPWESEPDVGRVAHGVPSRVDRLRALGNALVPQIAEIIGRRIVEIER